MRLKIAWCGKVLVCWALLGAGPIWADSPPSVDEKLVPLRAATAVELVPAGWEESDRLTHDFNGDERADLALVVTRSRSSDSLGEDNDRILILALGEVTGFRRVVATYCVALCSACGGILGDPYQSLKLSPAGSLWVTNHGGSAERWTTRYTIAWREQRFLLVGYDSEVQFIHEPGRVEARSVNLLTGRYRDRGEKVAKRHSLQAIDPSRCDEGLEAAVTVL